MESKEIKQLVDRCIKRWGYDSRVENLHRDVFKWLNYIKEDDREIYLSLLDNFEYYSKKKENKYAEFIIEEIKKIDYGINKTIIIPLLKESEGMNGSYKILRSIQLVGRLAAEVCPTNLSRFIEEYGENIAMIKNIVIVDDISGTGNTLKKSLDYMKSRYPELFQEKNIYLTCLVTTETAQDFIYKNITSDKIKYWSYNIAKKAFKENYIFKGNAFEEAKNRVKTYEELLSTCKQKSDIFGYKGSELLIAFSDNTPNNTLLSFRKENKNWKALFPRYITNNHPSWSKTIKKNANANISKKMNSR